MLAYRVKCNRLCSPSSSTTAEVFVGWVGDWEGVIPEMRECYSQFVYFVRWGPKTWYAHYTAAVKRPFKLEYIVRVQYTLFTTKYLRTVWMCLAMYSPVQLPWRGCCSRALTYLDPNQCSIGSLTIHRSADRFEFVHSIGIIKVRQTWVREDWWRVGRGEVKDK